MGGKRRLTIADDDTTSAENMMLSADSVKRRRTCEKTKSSYKGIIKHVADWYEVKHPELVDDGTLLLPLPVETVVEFFGHLCSAATAREKLKGPEELSDATSREPYCATYITSHRSAMVDLYRRSEIPISAELEREWGQILKGYDKLLNHLKKKGLFKLSRGKRELRKVGYILLCEKFMKFTPESRGASWSTSIFGWCFFTLLWNLISRPESVEDLTLPMITWKEDCLAIDEEVLIMYYTVLFSVILLYCICFTF